MARTREQHDLTKDPLTMFWLIKTTPEWLSLPARGENGRFAFGREVLEPILARYPGARMRFFDTEAYTADCSDVMVWTVTDLDDYNGAVNDLRETKFWSAYFTVEKIIPAIENEYAKHYNSDLIGEGLAFRAE